MSGGGSKPKGGKMGTSIRATNVSGEAVASAERKLSELTVKLNEIRQGMKELTVKLNEIRQGGGAAEKKIAAFELDLAKSHKEVMLISESRKALLWSCWYQALSFPPFFYRLTV